MRMPVSDNKGRLVIEAPVFQNGMKQQFIRWDKNEEPVLWGTERLPESQLDRTIREAMEAVKAAR